MPPSSGAPDLTLPAPALHAGKRTLRIGYVPLTDAAPLLAAEELGLFAAAGLRVTLSAERAWAAIRDKLAFGALDAAHLLGPIPIAAALGLGGMPVRRLTVAAGLGQNGNTIILSHALAAEVGEGFAAPLPAAAFAAALSRWRESGRAPVVLAMVFPFSSHNYLLRHWLAAGGLDPDRDLRLVALPPPLTAQALAQGTIDGFCAGEPWGSLAVARGAGRVALGTGDIWRHHPEKLLAFAEDASERDPERAIATTGAIIAAARWLDDPAHREDAARLLQARVFPTFETGLIAAALAGQVAAAPDEVPLPLSAALRFRPATRPDPGAAAWWLSAMRRWDHLPEGADTTAALAPWRNDLWRQAAAHCGEPIPPPGNPAPRNPPPGNPTSSLPESPQA